MPMPRRYIKQILRANDRGGRKAASRTSQRALAGCSPSLAREAPRLM